MGKNSFYTTLLLACLLGISLYSCREPRTVSNDPTAKLRFSLDTLFFDTVFTNIGSTTHRFKVYNDQNRALNIEKILLGAGESSNFRLNADGHSGKSLSDIFIAAGDSMFVFAEVTIDPSDANMPFVINDSVIFITNGNTQDVNLVAWGENAHFYRDSVLDCDVTWTNDRPYLIYNSILVNRGCTLTIEKGVRVYNHKSSRIFVLGTLIVNGELGDSVLFQTDRLEGFLDDEPGQWIGIHFLVGSINNLINYAVIKNAFWGVRVDSLPADGSDNANLQITNSIMKHHQIAGIIGFQGRIISINNLIYNCGQFGIAALIGGRVDVFHTTIGNFNFLFNRQDPSVVLSDNFDTGVELITAPLQATFINNIIWGSLEEEFVINGDGGEAIALNLKNNLVRTTSDFFNNENEFADSNVLNEDPLFVDAEEEDYHLDSLSPARGIGSNLGSVSPIFSIDLDGKTRSESPTVGCYELLP